MSVLHPHSVQCTCGVTVSVMLAESINVLRSPPLRERILQGELHRARCPACGHSFTVERPFYYIDPTRGSLFKVLPRGERHRFRRESAALERASRRVPDGALSADRNLRVVFGMDELREKLVAQDLALDDRFVELLKVLLIYEHPTLVRHPRLRFHLVNASTSGLNFRAAYEHSPRRFQVFVPRWLVDELVERGDALQKWARKSPSTDIFSARDHWVSVWRWSPQPHALAELERTAAELRRDGSVDLGKLSTVLRGLPHAEHLPPWAKQDLRALWQHALARDANAVAEQIFEHRFAIDIASDFFTAARDSELDALWKLLSDLPDSNVEGNTRLEELILESGGGGWYDPATGDVGLGERILADREQFEDVVRHEVGHAVHELRSALVDGWLQSRFGWHTFDAGDDAQIDRWVELMGGWKGLSPTQQGQVRHYVRAALGQRGSWEPGGQPSAPAGHPWHKLDFGPRLACEGSLGHWYHTFEKWHRADGKAFFLNYYYGTLMVIDEATLKLVAEMPDRYAAMSHFEFFAELYALYYDRDDHQRSVIPQDVGAWLDANIGAPAVDPPRPARPQRPAWEAIRRPS